MQAVVTIHLGHLPYNSHLPYNNCKVTLGDISCEVGKILASQSLEWYPESGIHGPVQPCFEFTAY